MSEINIIKWLCLIYKLIQKNKLHFNYIDNNQAQVWLAYSFPETAKRQREANAVGQSQFIPYTTGGFE